MAQGRYERTPLTRARVRLTCNGKKIERLQAELKRAEQERVRLKQELTKLEAEAAA